MRIVRVLLILTSFYLTPSCSGDELDDSDLATNEFYYYKCNGEWILGRFRTAERSDCHPDWENTVDGWMQKMKKQGYVPAAPQEEGVIEKRRERRRK